jgi:two-component system sensor histidine kinase UhpB
LRPEVLDELGLVPAVRNLCDRIQESTGLVVHRTLAPDLPKLSADAELVVYGLALVAVTNIDRHPPSYTADLSLAARDGHVELIVHDEGVGVGERTAEDSAGGIRGMRERALLIGARLEVLPAEGRGTDVRLCAPLTP